MIRIGIEHLDEWEIGQVRRLCEAVPFGFEPEDLFKAEVAGLKQLWRLEQEDYSGLVVTEIAIHPKGKELVVWGIVGHGLIKAAREIFSDCKDFGISQNCKWITFRGTRPALQRIYEKTVGMKTLEKLYVMEL